MKTLRKHYPVTVMSRVFEVSKSGYYTWLKRAPSKRSQDNARLEVAIKAAHMRTRQSYGPERLRDELADDGFPAGVGRIKRLRKQMGIRCKQTRKFKATTNSNHGLPVAENLLQQNFSTDRPRQVWVADITYIPTHEGWLYLAGIKDLHTCEIVGYALGERMTKELVARALFGAVSQHRPPPGLIHHSDRGSQYCAHDYRRLLTQFGMRCSMSRKGNCYDNAPMESFWGTLKTELVHHRRYETRAQAKSEITEYIEIFYNRQRRHSKLGNLAPAVFAQQYQQRAAA
jgi:transposase InsO family protein